MFLTAATVVYLLLKMLSARKRSRGSLLNIYEDFRVTCHLHLLGKIFLFKIEIYIQVTY
jgi:hypothetical protein